jgi:coatomer subunit beta'
MFGDNVSSISFVHNLPFFAACAEDGKLNLVSTKTFEIVGEYDHFMKKAWSIHILDRKMAIGYDEGCMVIQIGQETPLFSFTKGKLILCKNSAFFTSNLKAVLTKNLKDFEAIKLEKKEIGSTDLFPKDLQHSPNGQYFFVTDGNEFAIHKSQTGKQTTFGTCDGIVWSPQNNLCVMDGNHTVRFLSPMGEELNSLELDFYVEKIFGGELLGVVGLDFVVFYDYETLDYMGKIIDQITDVQWPVKQDELVVGTPDGFYMLEYEGAEEEEDDEEEEVEGSFRVVEEVEERFTSGLWVDKVFFFLKESSKICLMSVGGPMTIGSLPFKSSIIGYLKNQNLLYLMDDKGVIFTFSFSHKLIKTIAKVNAMIEDENDEGLKKAVNSFKSLNTKDYDLLSKILLANSKQELAFKTARDPQIKFNIALSEKMLKEAQEICEEIQDPLKWKRLGDEAMLSGRFLIAKRAFLKGEDLNSLLMLGSCLGDAQLVEYVSKKALKIQHFSVAFCSFWILRDLENCHKTLILSKR